MENSDKKLIKSFKDLEVYQNSYKAMLLVIKEIIPRIPKSEKYDLKDQLSRSCKSIPRLIAEGYAKKHQKLGFQKYLDDAMGECNETIVSLEQVKDIYGIRPELCDELINIYDKLARQLFNLANAWDSFKFRSRKATPLNDTGSHNRTLKQSGQSLIEVLVGLAVGGILIAGAAGAIALLLKNSAETRNTQTASFLAQELTENLSAIAEADWHKIYGLAKGAANHYYISSSTREIIPGEEPVSVEGKTFTRYFYVENVNRTKCGVGDITENVFTTCASWPGDANAISEDPSTQKLTVKIEWPGGRNLNQTKYLTRSRNISFRQTDWSAGPNQENFPTSAVGTIVNNRFASSTGIDYSTGGSIKIRF